MSLMTLMRVHYTCPYRHKFVAVARFTGDSMIRAVLFDVGGVLLVSSRGLNYDVAMRAMDEDIARRLGVAPESVHAAMRRYLPEARRGLLTKREFLLQLGKLKERLRL